MPSHRTDWKLTITMPSVTKTRKTWNVMRAITSWALITTTSWWTSSTKRHSNTSQSNYPMAAKIETSWSKMVMRLLKITFTKVTLFDSWSASLTCQLSLEINLSSMLHGLLNTLKNKILTKQKKKILMTLILIRVRAERIEEIL